jgi:hypothetical protein
VGRIQSTVYSIPAIKYFIFIYLFIYSILKSIYYASETWTLTKRDRKQQNVFERKVCRRILGPVYDNEKEKWRILTNKEVYASVKKTYYNRDNKVK